MRTLVQGLVLAGLVTPALAQDVQRIEITGSSIKRIAAEGALPVTIITRAELTREGISSSEQLVQFLTSNGNGLDNLASNADVVDGAARGNNGATSANLRGQGSNATLILLNGRRVAAHGLNGGVVDLNQIPFSAIERIEVLKDGASAIYGTDAVGGVINFITRRNYQGVTAEAFADITEQGGGNILKGAVTAGFGDLDKQGFNLLATLSFSDNKALRGEERSFTSSFQSNRGLSPDTRGTPHGTIFNLAGTIFPTAASMPLIPGTTIRADGGINVLNLPGGPGCSSIDGTAPYDFVLWAAPGRRFACTWDTARAAVIQQPVENTSLLARGSLKLGAHLLSAEFVASKVDSAKRFSNIQLLPSTGLNPLRFPRNSASAAAYDAIFNRLVAVFPAIEPQRGLPISYRWRCIECGPREIETTAETQRFFAGIEGPLAGAWEYKAGISQASSEASSVLGSGYHYRRDGTFNGVAYKGIVDALNTGVINPFLLPGQTQSQAALDLLASTSAEGVKLYGGKFTTTQTDAAATGPLFKMGGGEAMAAVGVDLRKEKYRFTGDERASNQRPEIIGAPFDDGNALAGVTRDIKAVYGELLLPLVKGAEVTLAVRRDDYTGFGTTTNPKVSFRWQPSPVFLTRGSYNTAFRVPSFNQIYNGRIEQQYLGSDISDPARCPGGRPIANDPNCTLATNLVTVNGGTLDLGPETAKQFSVGFVVEPSPNFSVSMDWWSIERTDQIRVLGLRDLIDNYALFTNRFLRDANGVLTGIDQRWINSGGSKTKGIEVGVRGNGPMLTGKWSGGMDLSYLLEKKSRLTVNAPYGASEVGRNTLAGDLGVRWKHNAWFTYTQGPWSGTVSQIYRTGVKDRTAPGVASGAIVPPLWTAKTEAYVVHNVALTYTGLKNLTLTAGIKNLLGVDPPFSYTYDDVTGAGGAWDPRVADPRGRSYTLKLEYRFL
ncbi:MAG TPA: TonB-dependent receptor [Burkholderiaceae bacterium]|nr:TonB-dependent receptor [Burkholderiaceae bacterium]